MTTLDDLALALATVARAVAEHVQHPAAHLDADAQVASIGERPQIQDAEEELGATLALMALEPLLREGGSP